MTQNSVLTPRSAQKDSAASVSDRDVMGRIPVLVMAEEPALVVRGGDDFLFCGWEYIPPAAAAGNSGDGDGDVALSMGG